MTDKGNRDKYENKNRIIKIPMNSIGDESPMCIPWNIQYYDISDLQPGHANSGSPESDLVSGKMKGAVIHYNSSAITIIYNIYLITSDTI